MISNLSIREVTLEELIDRGVKFHGHLGPFLVLGIKMGILALKKLNSKGYFDLSVAVELEKHPPVYCLVDGIQISTGCSLGKGNIKVKQNNQLVKAIFNKDEHNLSIQLKPEILNMINFMEESCEEIADKVAKMSDEKLFIF